MSQNRTLAWLRHLAVAAVLMVVPVASAVTVSSPAQAAGYDAGYEATATGNSNDGNLGDCDADQWGFCRRNCTSFTAYKLNQAGVPFSNWYKQPTGYRWGNAAQWKAAADRAGIPYGDTPKVGSVAWWDGSRAGGFGHVAWVESVNADGSVNVTSYNGLNETYYPENNVRAMKYLYFANVTNSTPPPPPPPSAPTDANGDRVAKFGGDFNGDGYGDVVAFSVYPDGAGFNVYLYTGSAGGGLNDPVPQMYLGPTAGGWDWRSSKTVVTNVNGDAYQDLVIFHRGPNNEVVRHIFTGSATGIQSSSNWVVWQSAGGWDWRNVYLAGGGDVNGDGYGDVVAYSVYPDGAGFNVYLYTGSASGGLQGPAFQMYLGPSAGGWDFRSSKYLTVNVNGDAYQDLVIFHKGPGDEIGRHLLKGSATGLQPSDPNTVALQTPASGWYWSNLKVAGGGDYNGDGYGDVAAFSKNPDGSFNAYIYPGSTTNLQTPQFQSALGSASVGWSFSGSKPVATNANGDGYMDLVVLHRGPNDAFVRHIIRGSATVLQPTAPGADVWQYPNQGGWYWSKVFIG